MIKNCFYVSVCKSISFLFGYKTKTFFLLTLCLYVDNDGDKKRKAAIGSLSYS